MHTAILTTIIALGVTVLIIMAWSIWRGSLRDRYASMVFGILLLGILFGVWKDYSHPRICVQEATVTSILEVTNEAIIVQTNTNKKITLYTNKLKIGDKVCVIWGRK